jgi:hypothetical protein
MKHPDLIPLYVDLLCNEELSEEMEDVSQYLFQRAVDTNAIRPDVDENTEPMMIRLLDLSAAAAANTELHCLANKLEALLLEEFSDQIGEASSLVDRRLDA